MPYLHGFVCYPSIDITLQLEINAFLADSIWK